MRELLKFPKVIGMSKHISEHLYLILLEKSKLYVYSNFCFTLNVDPLVEKKCCIVTDMIC